MLYIIRGIMFLLNVSRRLRQSIITLQTRLQKSPSFFVRLGLIIALFLTALAYLITYTLSLLFYSPQESFQLLNTLSPERGYTASYSKHAAISKGIRLTTAATTLVIVILTALNSFVATPQPVRAVVDCTILTGTTTLNQAYIDSNNCGNVIVTGGGPATATIVFSSIDLGGAGDYTLTINSGVTVTASETGALTLSDTGDSLVINGTLKHEVSNAGNVTITAQNVTIGSTGSINLDGLGCTGGPTGGGSADGYGPNTSTGICAQTTSGYGIGSGAGGSHGGAGGRGKNAFTGTTYDVNTAPVLKGSGGGAGASGGASRGAGGAGGGILRMTVAGTLTVDGPITANGTAGGNGGGGGSHEAGGGGSGGSIYLDVGTLDGDSSMDANGGTGGNAATSNDGGGGGGGRVAVYYTTDNSSFLSFLNAANTTTGGAAGGATGGAEAGANGSFYTLQYAVPSAPTISAPTAGATDVSRNPTTTSSAYSSNGKTHVSTDWQISDDNTFSNDCSDTNIVYCKLDDASNLESIVVNTTNGTFQNALSGKTKLAPNTTYYVRVRHTNIIGDSSWSSSVSFTTAANTVPSTPTNSTPANSATDVSKNPTLTSSSYSESDGDSHSSTDWLVYESSTCSGTADWSKTADATNLTSIVVNSTNGTFADALAGKTKLNGHTTYSFKLRHTDAYSGNSSYSSCTSFTTLNTAPTASAGSDQSPNEDAGTVTLSAASSSDADDDTLTYSWLETVDGSDACSLSGSTTVSATVTITNKDSNYSCEYRVTVSDSITTAQDTVAINITADNDAPSLTQVSDKTVAEAEALTFSIGATDVDTTRVTLSAADANGDFTNNDLDVTDYFTDNADNTGTFSWTPNYRADGTYQLTIKGQDGTNTATEIVNITVNNINNPPAFTGELPTISFVAGTTTNALFDLDEYFTDPENDTLTYSTTGNSGVTVSIASDGTVTMSTSADFAGSEAITFIATDESGATASSNVVAVTVSEPENNSISADDVDHAEGTSTGEGVIVIRDEDNNVLATWTAFPNGGVIPRLVTVGKKSYIFAVKRRYGSTVRVYTLNGELVTKRRLGKQVRFRQLAVGNLNEDDDRQEIVISTHRDNDVFLRIFSYSVKKKEFNLLKEAKFKGVNSRKYSIAIQKRKIKLYSRNGKLKFEWKPF